jgi:hypothetical protein
MCFSKVQFEARAADLGTGSMAGSDRAATLSA